jgi:hypothetical protein
MGFALSPVMLGGAGDGVGAALSGGEQGSMDCGAM